MSLYLHPWVPNGVNWVVEDGRAHIITFYCAEHLVAEFKCGMTKGFTVPKHYQVYSHYQIFHEPPCPKCYEAYHGPCNKMGRIK